MHKLICSNFVRNEALTKLTQQIEDNAINALQVISSRELRNRIDLERKLRRIYVRRFINFSGKKNMKKVENHTKNPQTILEFK